MLGLGQRRRGRLFRQRVRSGQGFSLLRSFRRLIGNFYFRRRSEERFFFGGGVLAATGSSGVSALASMEVSTGPSAEMPAWEGLAPPLRSKAKERGAAARPRPRPPLDRRRRAGEVLGGKAPRSALIPYQTSFGARLPGS